LLRFLIKLKTAKALGLTDPAGTLLGVAAQAVGMAIKTTFGSDEGEARCHAPELDLVLEVVGP
jgi:hypothetical protein